MTGMGRLGAREALMHFLAVQGKGDMAAVATLFHPEHTGFGTGRDELMLGRDQTLEFIERQRRQVSEVRAGRFEVHSVQELSTDVAVASCSATYKVSLHGEELELPVRMTFVLHRVDGHWQMAHQHVSEPSGEQSEGEAYPVQRLQARAQELERLVAERTMELREAMAALRTAAITDRLTGLYNRTMLDELLAKEMASLGRGGRRSAIVIIDVDNFKAVNDVHGHLVGDAVLRDVAAVLDGCVRSSDSVGRWGGEEFVLLLPEIDIDGLQAVNRRIRAALAAHIFPMSIAITVSAGCAFNDGNASLDEWLSRADALLYTAKRSGRNRFLGDEN